MGAAASGETHAMEEFWMILVTGGAGFIGSNFVLDWLSGVGEPVVLRQALGSL